MNTGVTYLLGKWDKLLVPFTQDGRLEVDNGCAERRLRPVASGRKAWQVAGSASGAHRFAETLSLVSTADAAGVDPGSYNADILPRVDSWPNARRLSCFPTFGLWSTMGSNKPANSPPKLNSLNVPGTPHNYRRTLRHARCPLRDAYSAGLQAPRSLPATLRTNELPHFV